ncbi:hypothetical protein B9479_001514 [Cryptococcus floricola]|uniref:SNARE-complex protein Syntaxin-18 N-terminal domain-containing protein n=1 Tax=Cryptococcus floricola TaxID=2591691 RepID=A0A5D3B532_9TREE|nr:hypothetical protein B9479_001514 [Cryptococcus floricola]
MAPIDQTDQFRSIFSTKQSALPPSARSKSPPPRGGRSASRGKGKGKQGDEGEESFLKESYQIYTHLASLRHLLTSVRKPYLSSAEPPPMSRRRPQRPTSSQAGDDGQVEEWAKWEKSKYLTDKERDEIDLRARMILRRCNERVGVLERAERARKTKVNSSLPASSLFQLLPSLALPSSPSTSSEPIISAHHASIIWTLNDTMAKLTGTLSDMQTERVKRREERGRTLGNGASAEAERLGRARKAGEGRSIPDGVVVDVHDAALSPTMGSDPHLHSGLGIIDPSAPPIESQLSQAQMQEFESENNALLEHMSSTLSSVLSAESSLLEISQLQSELVRHLAQQTEVVEQLYEDAVGSVAEVRKANDQLVKARERGKEGRLFLLVFILGASFSLLFLDWYAS